MKRRRQVRVSEDLYLILKELSDENQISMYNTSDLIARKIKNDKKKTEWDWFKL